DVPVVPPGAGRGGVAGVATVDRVLHRVLVASRRWRRRHIPDRWVVTGRATATQHVDGDAVDAGIAAVRVRAYDRELLRTRLEAVACRNLEDDPAGGGGRARR